MSEISQARKEKGGYRGGAEWGVSVQGGQVLFGDDENILETDGGGGSVRT